jgi:peptide/nickel transport system substrate-binding protein
MHGTPALPADFSHLPYVNPAAPKGGRLVQGILGTFDSLNPLIVRGLAVQQIRGFVIESLLARGNDEPFTLYGLLADSVQTDDARTEVTFHLNPLARFSDGHPVLAEDVLFSWELLRDHGRPNHRLYYAKVTEAKAIDQHTVRFRFGDAGDRELPLVLGLMPVLPKHAIDVAATRFRPLSRHNREAWHQRDADARPELLGPRSADQPRALELRRDPAGFLPRRQHPVRGLQTRAL